MIGGSGRAVEIVDLLLSDGRTLRARRRRGRGAPLVFVHGLLDSSEGWSDVAAASRRPSVAFDLPGFGGSDCPTRPRMSAYAHDLVEAMRLLELEAVTLVGHSLGGAVAARIAELIPQGVASLALLAPAGFGRIPIAEAVSMPVVRGVTRTFLPVVLKAPLALTASYRLFVAAGASPTPEVSERVKREAQSAAAGVVLATQAIVAAGRKAGAPRTTTFTGPVEALWGDADRVVPRSHGVAVQRTFPQAQLTLWERMGHHPQRERPAALNGFIERACRRGDAACAPVDADVRRRALRGGGAAAVAGRRPAVA